MAVCCSATASASTSASGSDGSVAANSAASWRLSGTPRGPRTPPRRPPRGVHRRARRTPRAPTASRPGRPLLRACSARRSRCRAPRCSASRTVGTRRGGPPPAAQPASSSAPAKRSAVDVMIRGMERIPLGFDVDAVQPSDDPPTRARRARAYVSNPSPRASASSAAGCVVPAGGRRGRATIGEVDADRRHRLGRERPAADPRPCASDVRSVSRPSSRSSMTSPAKRAARRRGPVKPDAYATLPSRARRRSAERVLASIAPAQRCVNRRPSSCGKVVRKWLASRSNVARAAPRTRRGRGGRVVHRVVAAEQDAAVGAEPVVVELVGQVAHALAVPPAELGRRSSPSGSVMST